MSRPLPDPLEQLRVRLAASPSRTAILLDFDGTLAPIVEDPSEARPVPGVGPLLDRLSRRFARVAVVSGRPRRFLVDHLGPEVDLSGLYGLEARRSGVTIDHPEAEPFRATVDELARDALDRFGGTAVTVEPKGLSLTVHFRQAADEATSVVSWADAAAARTGFESRSAKRSVELHPPVAVDKGTVVRELGAGCDVVAYIGDDVGDLPAFAALDVLRTEGVETYKVAVRTTELPPEVAAAADVELVGPEAVVALLVSLDGAT